MKTTSSVGQSQSITAIVVDDSALIRQTVCSILKQIPNVNVVAVARDGMEALERVERFQPDFITLDVQMPNLDGIETLREMKRRRLGTRAIMLSSLTEKGASVTMEALFEGAFDFIHKPAGGLGKNRDELLRQLSDKISALRQHFRTTNRSVQKEVSESRLPPDPNRSSIQCDLVVIGASTGGPKALQTIVPRLSSDLQVPVILVQHIPAGYTRSMAERLSSMSKIKVVEASENLALRGGHVYLAPGGSHLGICRQNSTMVCRLVDSAPIHSCRPAVDFTLQQAFALCNERVLGVILTGMGKDGRQGCETIYRAGGTVFAQDEATSAVFGMPKAVIESGNATRVLPIGKIAAAINRHVARHARTASNDRGPTVEQR